MDSFYHKIDTFDETKPVDRGQSGFADLLSYERLSVSVSEEDALQRYREAAAQKKGTPVLLANDFSGILRDSAIFAQENGETTPKQIQAMLQESTEYNSDHFFTDRFKRLAFSWRHIHHSSECELLENSGLSCGFEPCLFELLRLPTENPWEIPAYLPFFHPYDGPELEQLISILKEWHTQYGAQILCISFDMLQFTFQRNQMNDEHYHRLAREIFCLHPALVTDYYQSFDNLVYNLQHTAEPIFPLWWD